MQKRAFSATVTSVMLTALVYNAHFAPQTLLEQVKRSGELHVVTRDAATTYYVSPQGPSGLEYDLSKKFADYLGVKLEITVRDNINDIIEQVDNGAAHLAAAGLTITDERKESVRFTAPYQYITQQVVYHRKNTAKPVRVTDMVNKQIKVVSDSSHAAHLKKLQVLFPRLHWEENDHAGTTELLSQVANKEIDFTIADSNEVTLNRRFHPELRVAMDITKKQPLAWAFAKGEDDSLYNEAQKFMAHMQETGELKRLIKRHYTHANNYDYLGTRIYLKQVRRRLPRYQALFEEAAATHKLDWRLLASVAYQESHWNPHAVSPTGVRGIMMLTRRTSTQMGVTERTDPKQSIFGGARYLRRLIGKVDSEYGLNGPERLWFALAAYNVGFGHVTDARMLTKLRGGNPDKWTDVKETLPLLTKRKWYSKTRFGYARGEEPVKYVESIRSYYDVLNWYLDNDKPRYAERSILAFQSSVL